MPIFEYSCSNCGYVFEKLVLTRHQEAPGVPAMWSEAGAAKVLNLCHSRHCEQAGRRRLRAFRRRLTAMSRKQAAFGSSDRKFSLSTSSLKSDFELPL